jgi:hypothetical protein
VPWGQDRLVPIFLATLAIRQQNRVIRFRSAAAMLDTFGMQQSGTQYRRLVAAFQRIFGATIFFGTDTQRQKPMVVHQARFSFMSEARIWYSRHSDQETLPYEFQNEIVLSPEFFKEILDHPIPTDMEAAKALSCSPAALDLFTWLSCRCFVAKGRERVPLFGDSGLGVNWAVPITVAHANSANDWKVGSTWSGPCGRRVLPQSIRTAPVFLWTEQMRFSRREAIMGLNEHKVGIWRLSLEHRRDRGRSPWASSRAGKPARPCFSRQVAMYLAKNVAGWSTPRIGRFYNGRHHTTVLHAIAKIERLRQADETIDALIEVLTATLSPSMEGQLSQRFERGWSTALIDAVAARVLEQISGFGR